VRQNATGVLAHLSHGNNIMKRPRWLMIVPLLCAASVFGQDLSPRETVAEIDGEKITADELRQAAGQPLASLEEQAYVLKQQKLQQLIADRLLAQEARRQNITVEALVEHETASKITPATAEDIHGLYEANKAQLQKPESDAEVQNLLRTFLRDQKVAARRLEYVKSLQSRSTVAMHLERPMPFRANVAATGPSRGSTNAPVTIVEFEDFQCPFCRKAHETLEKVLVRYKNDVRLVHRDFPLQPLHPAAFKAHEAARCAEKQGKFWEYRGLLYDKAPAAAPEQLNEYARTSGLDAAAFKQCLENGASRTVIQKDVDEGNRVGVNGTPAFFINGRLLSGANPESEFARIIDEELSKRASR